MKITTEQFERLVKVTNPYKKGIYHACITWNGYDYEESAISPETAKWLLFNEHFR